MSIDKLGGGWRSGVDHFHIYAGSDNGDKEIPHGRKESELGEGIKRGSE